MARLSLIQLRAGTATAWSNANPTLAAGEPGLETDTRKIKFGDGSTAWNSLSYSAAGTADVATTATKITASGSDRTVFVGSSTPSSPASGDIWIQV